MQTISVEPEEMHPAHLFVDDTEIYQSVPLNSVAWHCGAQTYKHAYCRNANSIGIEMCCTAGNYKISEKTKQNAAYLCAYICKMLSISAGEVDKYVLRHWDVTGKIARHRWQEVTMLNG